MPWPGPASRLPALRRLMRETVDLGAVAFGAVGFETVGVGALARGLAALARLLLAPVTDLPRAALAGFLRVTAFFAETGFLPEAFFRLVLARFFTAVDLRADVFFLRVTVFLPVGRALAFGRFAATAFFLRAVFLPVAAPLRLADRFFAVVFRAPDLLVAAIAQSSSIEFHRTEHYTTETRRVKRAGCSPIRAEPRSRDRSIPAGDALRRQSYGCRRAR